jgi:hypothetical protein
MGVADVMSGKVRFDCRGRRPGILDAVHALRPARSEVAWVSRLRSWVKLGALHELKNTRDPQEKIEVNNRLEEIQRTLAMETEAKEKAAQMRIKNCYRLETGKMNPETFYCIKEKHASREISSLEVDGKSSLILKK